MIRRATEIVPSYGKLYRDAEMVPRRGRCTNIDGYTEVWFSTHDCVDNTSTRRCLLPRYITVIQFLCAGKQ